MKKKPKIIAVIIVLIIFTASVPIFYFIILKTTKDKEIPPTDIALNLDFKFTELYSFTPNPPNPVWFDSLFTFDIWTNASGVWELYEVGLNTFENGYSTVILPNTYYEVRWDVGGVDYAFEIYNPNGLLTVLVEPQTITAHFVYSGGLGDIEGLLVDLYFGVEYVFSLTTDEFGIVCFDKIHFSRPDGVYLYELRYNGQILTDIVREQITVDVQIEIEKAATVGFYFVESIRDTLYFYKINKESDRK